MERWLHENSLECNWTPYTSCAGGVERRGQRPPTPYLPVEHDWLWLSLPPTTLWFAPLFLPLFSAAIVYRRHQHFAIHFIYI